MIELFSDPASVFWTIVGAIYIIYVISLAFEKDHPSQYTGNDRSYIPSKPNSYPQKRDNSNDFDPVVGKALDVVAGALKRDKTGMEFMSGALQGDFSTTKVSKARAGAALASVVLAAWAAKEKVGETTSRAGLEKQVDFGRKKLDDSKKHFS